MANVELPLGGGDPSAESRSAGTLAVVFGKVAAPFLDILDDIGATVTLLGQTVMWAVRPPFRAAQFLLALDFIGAGTTFIVGLVGLFTQNLIMMGIFFVVPLYLQLVLGLDALDTGIKMLPVSITMFLTSAVGSRLSSRFPVRTIVRSGLLVTVLAVLVLLATVQPELTDGAFAVSMAVLGIGMGLIASQLGNVVQSSVDASGRGEAGGLQYTGQQLGSSLGVALIGAIVLTGLTGVFVSQIENDTRISSEVASQVTTAVEPGVDFVSADQVTAAAAKAGLDQATTTALVDDYQAAQIQSLKAGLLAATLLALASLAFTKDLPHESPKAAGEGSPAAPGRRDPAAPVPS